MLIRAGIERARGIMTVVGTDADNVFMVLLARELNPKIFIVSRAIFNSAKRTLLAAGADKIVSPYDLGARRMAHAVLRPTVIEFLEMAFADESAEIEVEELRIKANSPLIDMCLMDSNIRRDYDVIIISVKKNDGRMVFNPGAETCLGADDTLVVVGMAASIKKLERVLAPP
jgi:voltage-gated potassium channel